MPAVRMWANKHRLDLLTLAAICSVIVLLWLPFGWNVSGLTDEWALLGSFEQGTELISFSSLRPFVTTFQHAGFLLTPDSFVGLNVIFAILLCARGFALYLAVGELIPGARVVASAVALLYITFYGDTGWFWLGTHGIAWSVLWTFVAIWLLLRQFRRPIWWLWLVVAVAQALALTYEVAFPVIFAAPLILPVLAGRFSRAVFRTAALWYAIPVIILILYVETFMSGAQSGYQQNQLQLALGSESPIRQMLESVIRAYKRMLGGAFLDRYTFWRESLPFLPYAAAITAISFALVWYSLRLRAPVFRWREVITAGLAGFALIGLGFVSYLVSEYRDVDYRVYFYSAAGSALFFCTGAYAVSFGGKWARRAAALGAIAVSLIIAPRLGKLALGIGGLLALLLPARWLFLLAVVMLTGMHASFSLWQHSLWAEGPRGQHWILSAIIQQAPRPTDGSMIVLLDQTTDERAVLEFERRRDMLQGAVRYLYDNPTLDAAFCIPGVETFNYWKESCAFLEDGFVSRWNHFGIDERITPYDQVLVFAFDESLGARLLAELPAGGDGYDPTEIAGLGEPLPPRADSALMDFPTAKPAQPINWPLIR